MEYSSNKLSKMSGVSPRALRYYDEIGLLKPAWVALSGYRMYGPNEVSRLQQILLYKELGFSLEDIKGLLEDPDYSREQTFLRHLSELHKKRERLDVLIDNVTKSMAATRGEITMTDKEKFEGFKQSLILENEQTYGAELQEKYGAEAIEESNAHLKGLTQAQYEKSEALRRDLEEALKAAHATGDPAGVLAQKACDLHRQWLCVFYPGYSKAYHKGLGETYAADERFRGYYDKIAPGCAVFLRDAIQIYCKV